MLALIRRQCNPAGRNNSNVLQRLVSYVQGQSPFPNSREYFYYIDHQGQVLSLFFPSFTDLEFGMDEWYFLSRWRYDLSWLKWLPTWTVKHMYLEFAPRVESAHRLFTRTIQISSWLSIPKPVLVYYGCHSPSRYKSLFLCRTCTSHIRTR